MTDNFLTSLGKRIRELRKKRDLSQEAVAKRLGVVKQTVSMWESGRMQPRSDVLEKLAALFDLSVADIVGGDLSPVYQPLTRAVSVKVYRFDDGVLMLQNDEPAKAIDTRATHATVSDKAIWLQILNEANSPRFTPGDLVLIDPKLTPEPGRMVAAMIDGRPVFARYRPKTLSTTIGATLAPDNNQWPTLVVSKHDTIVGVMVEHTTTSHG